MKKLLIMLVSSLLSFVFVFNVFASAVGAGTVSQNFWGGIWSAFNSFGGWLLLAYVLFRLIIWIVRKTENKTDDAILDNYVSKAVDFALNIIPKNTTVNWIKFVGNALGKFSEAYTKEQGDVPDQTTFNKAKSLITEVANQIEFKDIKTAITQAQAVLPTEAK